MSANSSGGNGADRRSRAQRAIAKGAQHLDDRLGDFLALSQDARAILSKALGSESYPFGERLADMLTLSVSASAAVVCCGDESDTGRPGTTVNGPDADTILFDIKSEMAGPFFHDLLVVGVTRGTPTDLVGAAGGVIASDHVVVRIVNRQLIISLCDLKGVAPDAYEGSVTLTFPDGTGGPFPIKALCKSTLWWLP